MHGNFGFDAPVKSTRWSEVKAGPSAASVRGHLEKLTTFRGRPTR